MNYIYISNFTTLSLVETNEKLYEEVDIFDILSTPTFNSISLNLSENWLLNCKKEVEDILNMYEDDNIVYTWVEVLNSDDCIKFNVLNNSQIVGRLQIVRTILN